MIEEFWDQICSIVKVRHKTDSDGKKMLTKIGRPIEEEMFVNHLRCRIDPVRYRSTHMWDDHPGEAIASDFKASIYTEWAARDPVISSDMRIYLYVPEHTGEGGIDDKSPLANLEVKNIPSVWVEGIYNIVAPPNRIRDLFGIPHHLEIQIDKRSNV